MVERELNWRQGWKRCLRERIWGETARIKPVARPAVPCILKSFTASISAKYLLYNKTVTLKVTVTESREDGSVGKAQQV